MWGWGVGVSFLSFFGRVFWRSKYRRPASTIKLRFFVFLFLHAKITQKIIVNESNGASGCQGSSGEVGYSENVL
jgi:hypothetical protein